MVSTVSREIASWTLHKSGSVPCADWMGFGYPALYLWPWAKHLEPLDGRWQDFGFALKRHLVPVHWKPLRTTKPCVIWMEWITTSPHSIPKSLARWRGRFFLCYNLGRLSVLVNMLDMMPRSNLYAICANVRMTVLTGFAVRGSNTFARRSWAGTLTTLSFLLAWCIIWWFPDCLP